MTLSNEDFLVVIQGRSSVREFIPGKIDPEKTEALLRAGMAAPSSRNVQPWILYGTEEPEILRHFSEKLPTADMVKDAALAIIVCGDTTLGNPDQEQKYNWIMDCSAVTQNILLAAHCLDLGAVWTGVFPYQERIDVVRKVLDLPSHVIPLSLIPVGYPVSHPVPKNKWKPEKIIWK